MLPADWAAVQQRVYEVVRDELAASDIDVVVWEQQRTTEGALPPTPVTPYASLRVTSGPVREGGPDVHTGEGEPDEDDEPTAIETIESDERWTLTVQLHLRSDPHPAVLTLRGALAASDVLDRLRAVGVVVVRVEPPVQLDAIAGGSFERRVALDVVLRSRARVTRTNVGYIDPDATAIAGAVVEGEITQ
jgi:hypothetical protein